MGVYLTTPNTEKDTEEGSYKSLKYAACSMQGWRTNMEDAHIIDHQVTDNVQVFGVFDGHGGKEVAIFVQRHFVEELKKNQKFIENNFSEALEEIFLRMDELLLTNEGKRELSQIKNGGGSEKSDNVGSWNNDSFAGCTANVALLYNYKDLYIANAGDSRTVVSENGTAHELSIDHKPDLNAEKERVKKAGGFITDGRINGNLNLSRAIGDMEYKKNPDLNQKEQLIIAFPEIKKRTLSSNDEFILMGCDGIWETKSNQELIEFCRDKIKGKASLKKTLEELLDSILAPDTANGFGCDNMTSLIVQFKEI